MAKAKKAVIEPKRSLVSQTFIPNLSLEAASRIAQALWDDFAGKEAAPHQIAIAIEMAPTSGTWRNLCGASIAYGLTEGGYNASTIKLTNIGRTIIAPTEEGADIAAKIAAVLSPKLLAEFFQKYNRANFPRDEIAKNVLSELGLPKDRTSKSLEIIKENGRYCGILRDIKGRLFVALDAPAATRPASPSIETPDPKDGIDLEDQVAEEHTHIATRTTNRSDDLSSRSSKPKQLFVAHGKNHKPLEDLKKILQQFKIAFKVAIDEPNKVALFRAKWLH